MYGMGDGALKIMKVLEEKNIPLAGFFASDEFVRGHSFMGYKVHRLSELEEQYGDLFILMAFGIHDIPMTERITKIAERHEFAAPDVPVIGDGLFDLDYIVKHENELQQVYDMLADEQSRKVFADILNYKISGDIRYLASCTTTPDEAYENILRLDENEDYADLGAYKGDTVEEFLKYTSGKYSSITAFEPDVKNHKKLTARMQELGIDADCRNISAHSTEEVLYFASRGGRHSSLDKEKGKPTQANSLDNVREGKRVSFINMDVEGAEKEAINGCKQTILKYQPKMLISIYHRTEDMFAIPLQVRDINPNYKFYMRHYRYIPAWDTNLYCISE
ncbi:MAG: FkbM family methyltransferase [Oscillospiraceae bacterium]|nr:FkbM family methyltransferase [Oscillospiraceae bacterium]